MSVLQFKLYKILLVPVSPHPLPRPPVLSGTKRPRLTPPTLLSRLVKSAMFGVLQLSKLYQGCYIVSLVRATPCNCLLLEIIRLCDDSKLTSRVEILNLSGLWTWTSLSKLIFLHIYAWRCGTLQGDASFLLLTNPTTIVMK